MFDNEKETLARSCENINVQFTAKMNSFTWPGDQRKLRKRNGYDKKQKYNNEKRKSGRPSNG